MMRRVAPIGVIVLSLVVSVSADLLPAPPFTLQDVDNTVSDTIKLKINTYTEAKTSYNWDVYCPGQTTKEGTVNFEYAPYTGDYSGGNANTFGGAIIRGGFKKTDTDCTLADGYTYRWLQHIIVSGDQSSNTIDGDPLYPDYTLAGYDALLFDAPGRGTLGNVGVRNISWLAESALVCVNETTKKVTAMDSFLWGFKIATNNGNTTVSSYVPQLWSTGTTPSFKSKFLDEFGASGTRDTGWTIADGCCCVPEPAMALFLGLGACLALSRRNGSLTGRSLHASMNN